jgi:hypothetical protein
MTMSLGNKKEIHFMGFLANSDTSILNVTLDHGFKIYDISEKKGVILLSIFEGLPSMEIHKKIMNFHCCSGEKLYYVGNSFESDVEMSDDGLFTSFPSEAAEFNNNLVCGYLNPVIQLMRLFKEGTICMPLMYYFFILRWRCPIAGSEINLPTNNQ